MLAHLSQSKYRKVGKLFSKQLIGNYFKIFSSSSQHKSILNQYRAHVKKKIDLED